MSMPNFNTKCLTYTVELTREEIDTVTTALNSEYKFLKEKYANARQQNAAEVYERMDEARTLRNDFARLIGVTFMGEDA